MMQNGPSTKPPSPVVRRIAICEGAGSVRLLDLGYPAGLCFPSHGHASANLCFLLAGSLTELYGRTERYGLPTRPLWYEAGSSHRGRIGSRGAWVLDVELPDPSEVPGPPRSPLGSARDPSVGIALARELHEELREGEEPLVVESLTHELLWWGFPEWSVRSSEPAAVSRVKELLRDDLTESYRLESIARLVDLHPSHLARCFRESTGMTIGGYLRRVRVRAASSLLEGDLPLAAVALEVGFADQSHLGRVFRRLMGTTPGRYRELMRS